MWDFVMDISGAGAGFLREFRFPLLIYIPSASPQSFSLSPEAGTIGQEWPQCQQPHKPDNKNKKEPLRTYIRLPFYGMLKDKQATTHGSEEAIELSC
jgi:hypothetical protein